MFCYNRTDDVGKSISLSGDGAEWRLVLLKECDIWLLGN